MHVVRKHIEVVIVVPSKMAVPSDEDVEAALRLALDCITPLEFDTVDEHPTWEVVAANVAAPSCRPAPGGASWRG